MNDWKNLSQSGNYERIVAEAKQAQTAEDFFLLVSAYLALGKGKEAMEVLLSHREELYKAKPLLALKANFETRFLLRQFDEAYEDLKIFSNYPYVSQAVEEQLRDLPNRIRVEEIAGRGKPVCDEDEMHDVLKNTRDPAALLAHLNSLKKSDLMPYFEDLHSLLEAEDVHDDVKSFALMLLSSRHDETEVSFEKGGKRFTLIPAEVKMPYSLPVYQGIRSSVTSIEDPTVAGVAGELLDQYVLALYPEIYQPLSVKEETLALRYLACRYLSRPMQEFQISSRERANAIDVALRLANPIEM